MKSDEVCLIVVLDVEMLPWLIRGGGCKCAEPCIVYTVIRGSSSGWGCLDIRRASHDEKGDNRRSNTMNELQLLLLRYASYTSDKVRRGVLDCGVGRENVAEARAPAVS